MNRNHSSAGNDPDISVSIVNWNTCDLLRGCLRSIDATRGVLTVEIFVVDNASSDGSADMVEDEFPCVNLIRNIDNAGFGKANNQAILSCRAPVILILNPDTVVLPGALLNMLNFLRTHPESGAIGCKMLNADGSLQFSLRTFPTIFTPFTENADLNWLPLLRRLYDRYRLFHWHHESVNEVDQPMGAAIMVRRSVIETLGAFDEDFHMFFEDVDLCYRIKRNGWKIHYIPAARIIHYGGCSVRQREKIGEEFYASLLKYFHKNKGGRYTLVTRFFMIVAGILYLGLLIPLLFFKPLLKIDSIKASLQIIRYGFSYSVPKTIKQRYVP